MGFLNDQETELKIQVGKDEFILFYKMTDNSGNGDGSGSASASESSLQQNKRMKMNHGLNSEVQDPRGVDGSTINTATANQVSSMAEIQKCEQAKQKFGMDFKQMSNKQ
mmetsp:Transcript_12544/g.27254  ORF Transcript_12544/g.27254 Transcript_12544/m.27254 type:complete len:109 (-) Transcript_12544:612-938(-)